MKIIQEIIAPKVLPGEIESQLINLFLNKEIPLRKRLEARAMDWNAQIPNKTLVRKAKIAKYAIELKEYLEQ